MKGLSEDEVKKSREEHGSNKLPEAEAKTFLGEFKETFQDTMIRLLLVIAGLMFVMFLFGYAEIYEPLGTVITVFIVACVTAKTNVASDTKYRALKNRTKKDECKVWRNGELIEIPVDDVVVGDVVLLQSGDKVPADGILVDGALKVDNSALNGEAEECDKIANAGAVFKDAEDGHAFVDESSLYRGAVTVDGEGSMKVFRVGTATMMGKMALEMQEDEPESPLQVKLGKLAKQISTFGYVGAIVIAIAYLLRAVVVAGGFPAFIDLGAVEIFREVLRSVSLAAVIVVCAVPEGLPLMISIVLMQNTSRMLDRNVLVRKAIGIETAGSLNILFSDKTGTITKGKLEVVEFFTGGGKSVEYTKSAAISKALSIAIGENTQSSFDASGNVIGGNFTDQALVKFLGASALAKVKEEYDSTVGDKQSFNSANKFSSVSVGGKTYYKGAPERLLAKATKYLSESGEIRDLDIDELNRKIGDLANKAMRVLAFGVSDSPLVKNEINDDTIIIGLVGIRDDARPEAKEAIREVQGAGIQVVMITGDRLETAKAIARDAGLLGDGDLALSSSEFNKMSDDEVKEVIGRVRVIARALPTDKSRMVRLCQEMNLVVGMTGDGVNDSPALKRADVGFAIGSGTEAAKEAGKIVILDDNFKSIKDAIWYGRTIYHNILKFCTFQLVINVAAVLVSSIAPFFGIDEPLKVTHLLFVNLVMDGLGAMMLGNEPALDRYMTEKPRRRDESIISKKMMENIIFMGAMITGVSGFFLLNSRIEGVYGSTEAHLTGYFIFFIWCALFNGFNVRDDGFGILKRLNENPDFLKIFATIAGVQFLIINAAVIPFAPFKAISAMFSCVPISWEGWFLAIIAAFITVIPTSLIFKALTRK